MTGLSTSEGAIVSNMKSRTVTITLSEDEWKELIGKHSLDIIMVKTRMRDKSLAEEVIHQVLTGRRVSEASGELSDPSVINGD